MLATANFLRAWSYARRPVLLVKMTLPATDVPGVGTNPARTLYLGTETITTPDSVTWEGRIGAADALHATGAQQSNGPELVGASFVINGTRFAWQADGKTIGNLFSDYTTQSIKVEMFLWEKSLTLSADMLCIYIGTVNRVVSEKDRLTIYAIQRRTWNRRLPVRTINALDYPNAPTDSTTPLPIIYGEHSARALRGGFDQSSLVDFNHCGIAKGVVPGYVVDKGAQNNRAKVLFAGHKLKTVTGLEATYPSNPIWVEAGLQNQCGNVYWDETLDSGIARMQVVNSATEAGFTFAADSMTAYIAVFPIDYRLRDEVGAPATTAGVVNPKRAIDFLDETAYADVPAANRLQMIMPQGGASGEILKAWLMIGHALPAGGTTHFAYLGGDGGEPILIVTNTATPKISIGGPSGVGTVWYDEVAVPVVADRMQWDFGRGVKTDVIVDSGATHVYMAGYLILYRPVFDILSAASSVKLPRQDVFGIRTAIVRTLNRAGIPINRPAIIAVNSPFFGNVQGYADDGSGTYTGTPDALIEVAPDIARHLLNVYGGVSLSLIDSAAYESDGTTPRFGSFAVARRLLRNSTSEWILSVVINNTTSVADVLKEITGQSGSMVFIDRFSDQWKWVFWGDQSVLTSGYGRDIVWDEIDSFSAELTSDTATSNGVRVRYWQDYRKNTTQLETFVNQAGSTTGYYIADVRDQKQVIDGTNYAPNWTLDGVTYTSLYGSHDYDGYGAVSGPAQFAAVVQATLRSDAAANSTANRIFCQYSFDVTTGVNDTLDFTMPDTTTTSFVFPQGRYSLIGMLDVLTLGFTEVMRTYGITSPRCYYTIADDGLSYTLHFNADIDVLFAVGAPHFSISAWPLLGFAASKNSTGSGTAYSVDCDWMPEAEKFFIIRTGTGPVPTPATGAGSFWLNAPTEIAAAWLKLMGFDPAGGPAMPIPGRAQVFIAAQSRGDRENRAIANAALYGDTFENVIDAPWIRDEVVAQRLRNTVFDLNAVPRVKVTFTAERLPDLQRGRVISFDPTTFDPQVAFPNPGTSGSWTGRYFRVTEVVQNLGPTNWTQEVVAIELTGAAPASAYSGLVRPVDPTDGGGSGPSGFGDDFGIDFGGS